MTFLNVFFRIKIIFCLMSLKFVPNGLTIYHDCFWYGLASSRLPQPSITQISLKITYLNFQSNLQWANPLTCGDQINLVWLGQYHGCWCLGSLRRQDISSHDINYVGSGLTWGRILSTCAILMWSNDIKCKYMFMFPLKNLARKGLS